MDDLDAVIVRLSHADRAERYSAVELLGASRDPKAVKPLATLLNDEDLAIRDMAISFLVKIGGVDVARAVQGLLYDQDVALRNTAVEILSSLGSEVEPEIIALALKEKDKDEDILKFAVDIIAIIGTSRSVEHLIPLLSHQSPNIRAAVVDTLGKLQAVEAVGKLVEMIDDDEDWVKFSVFEALGVIGSPDIVDRLLDTLKGDDISRIAAMDALSMLAGPDKLEEIIALSSKPEIAKLLSVDTVVRFAEAFSSVMKERHREVFLNIFTSRLGGDDLDEQRDVVRGLGLLKDRRAMGALLEFARHVNEYNVETPLVLKKALVAIGDTKAVCEAMRNTTSCVAVFVEALGEMGDPSTVRELQDFLKACDVCDDRELKKVTLESLEKLGRLASFDDLVNTLNDEDGHVRAIAARILADSRESRAVSIIYDAFEREPYANVREEMGRALSLFSAKDVEDVLINISHNEKADIRVIGIKALAGLDSEKGAQCLVKALGDTDPAVRCEALSGIVRFPGADMLGILTKSLEDLDRSVRMTVMEILSSRDDGQELVMRAMEDEDIWVRYKAINILGDRGVGEAEEAIIDLLEKDELPVKIACVKALGGFGSDRAVSALKGLVDHSDPNLSADARDALYRINEG